MWCVFWLFCFICFVPLEYWLVCSPFVLIVWYCCIAWSLFRYWFVEDQLSVSSSDMCVFPQLCLNCIFDMLVEISLKSCLLQNWKWKQNCRVNTLECRKFAILQQENNVHAWLFKNIIHSQMFQDLVVQAFVD